MAPVWAWPLDGGRQALRALATSVKTRRLGLCVVPCEVVRVCGGHVTVSYADTTDGASVRPNRKCAVLVENVRSGGQND